MRLCVVIGRNGEEVPELLLQRGCIRLFIAIHLQSIAIQWAMLPAGLYLLDGCTSIAAPILVAQTENEIGIDILFTST